MPYSLKQAADATGRQKTTILRAIQRGKVSATKDAHGEWEIDPAELHRVYEPASAALSKIERLHASINSTEDDAAQREIALLREMLTDKNAVIDDLREDRDRWRTQAEKLLLTDQRPKVGEVIAMPPPSTSTSSPAPATIPAAPSTDSPSRPAAAPAPVSVVKIKQAKKANGTAAKEAGWWRRMMGGK